MDKSELRKRFLKIRNSEPEQSRAHKSGLIHNRLFALDEYKFAEKIFVYKNFGSEVSTEGIISRCMADGKVTAVPATRENNEMDFVEINSGGIIMPDAKTLVLAPGVVFSRNKFRVGYGKGFYDRYLAGKILLSKIGIAFSFQLVDNIKNEAHDIALDYIITEEEIL